MPRRVQQPLRRLNTGEISFLRPPAGGYGRSSRTPFASAISEVRSALLLEQNVPVIKRSAMGSTNKLKLGIFGCNLNSGKNATLVPGRWSGSWDDNVRLAQMADDYN